ncbi:hypothetical protein [Azohydromonas lata]|uniref:Uncharacterized protein n=1 Tax=Azohydromonas lata TaxID=45677 RepID=A0ABU5IFH1_9BURK|nr:hypothetical protein [Azohydromonas lata]MDZ5457877.1 hypothetical protein [Azohydromonas lata]
MTSTELADLLSNIRMDGQSTSKSTISRWVNGAPAEPGVLLYLRERLVALAKKSPPSLGECRAIAIGGGKGGAGATTITFHLAAVADHLGYRVTLASINRIFDVNDKTAAALGLKIEHKAVDIANISNIKKSLTDKSDLLLIDYGSRTLTGFDDDYIGRADDFDLEGIDLFVIPFSPAVEWEYDPALKAVNTLMNYGITRFRLLPNIRRFDVGHLLGDTKAVEAIKEYHSYVTETCVYHREGLEWSTNFQAGNPDWAGMPEISLYYEYLSVFSDLLKAIGVDMEVENSVDKMSIEELLAYVRK